MVVFYFLLVNVPVSLVHYSQYLPPVLVNLLLNTNCLLFIYYLKQVSQTHALDGKDRSQKSYNMNPN